MQDVLLRAGESLEGLSVMCLALPSPLAQLVIKGVWQRLVFPRPFQSRMFAEFPSQQWYDETKTEATRPLQLARCELSYSSVHRLQTQLQHWSQQLGFLSSQLTLAEDVESIQAMQLEMREANGLVQSLLHRYDPMLCRQNLQASAELAARDILAVMVSFMLKDRNKTTELCLLLERLAGGTGALLQKSIRSSKTLRRCALQLDMASNIVRAKTDFESLGSAAVLRYAWLDSSPLERRSLNFMMGKYSQLRKDDVVAVARAANLLSKDCTSGGLAGFVS